MKRLKKPNYRQKKILSANGLDYMDWMVERQDNNSFTFVKRDKSEKITLRYK